MSSHVFKRLKRNLQTGKISFFQFMRSFVLQSIFICFHLGVKPLIKALKEAY